MAMPLVRPANFEPTGGLSPGYTLLYPPCWAHVGFYYKLAFPSPGCIPGSSCQLSLGVLGFTGFIIRILYYNLRNISYNCDP